jgi:hypothetical protein
MSNFQTIDQEVHKGAINGCSFAPRVRILARTNERLLIWAPGSNYWSGMYGTQYSGAEMRIIARRIHAKDSILVCDGKRLKNSIFAECADKIDAVFGEGFHKLLDTRKTVVIGDNPPFAIHGVEIPLTGREFGYDLVMKQRAERARLEALGVTGIELTLRSLSPA